MGINVRAYLTVLPLAVVAHSRCLTNVCSVKTLFLYSLTSPFHFLMFFELSLVMAVWMLVGKGFPDAEHFRRE